MTAIPGAEANSSGNPRPSRAGDFWRVAVVLFCILAGVPVIRGATVASANLPFEAEIRAFEAADAARPPAPDPILFVGSSTVARWTDLREAFSGHNVLNRGFGGSQFTDVLAHFDRLLIPNSPSLVVLYEGDNDLAGGRTVDQVFDDWTVLTRRIDSELPESGVLFISVKPSPSRVGFLAAQAELNERIAVDCEKRARYRFVDVAEAMVDDAGLPRSELFVSDLLHLNSAGYEVWQRVLAPHLEAWAVAHPEKSVRTPRGAAQIDFGDAAYSSGLESGVPGGGAEYWNNLTATVGASGAGRIGNLRAADGTRTDAAWVMRSRFNGANQNGTTSAAPFPTSATRDSLFGNTETFSGLANVTPAFEITGLRAGVPHELVFYASRMGVSDNRETRFTVTGSTTATADLNVANNVSGVARVTGVAPGPDGVLAIALSPGPANNNANHFVYLGALRIEEIGESGRVFLVDLGSADTPTETVGQPAEPWNDVTSEIGGDPKGSVEALVTREGGATGIGLIMVAPFNGVDRNGTEVSTAYPSNATRDSLTGSGGPEAVPLENQPQPPPAFRFVGLDPESVYSLAFYASRVGSAESWETRYFVRGLDERNAVLDPADNLNRSAWVTGVRPDANREIHVRLEPGPSNTASVRTVALGALRLEWREWRDPPPPWFSRVGWSDGGLNVGIHTAWGRSCVVEGSVDLSRWNSVVAVSPPSAGVEVSLPSPDRVGFHRLVDAP
ncbi:MAG: GDSL-type esterase/lipase family protein [Limisphaerales bacterium]